jgi:hypothetical protein
MNALVRKPVSQSSALSSSLTNALTFCFAAICIASALLRFATPARADVLAGIMASSTGSYLDPVFFGCSNSLIANGALSCSWDFGDGQSATATPSILHRYASPGTYTATVSVCDADGCDTARQTLALSSSPGQGPRSQCNVNTNGPYVGYQAGQTVTFSFSGTCSGTGVTEPQYDWIFGDGDTASTGNVARAQHVYANPGMYQVTMRFRIYDNVFGFIVSTVQAISTIVIGGAPPSPTAQEIFEQADPNGRVTIAIFERYSSSAHEHNTDFAITVPSDYVVIGGGGEGSQSPQGNLLTASYPSADLTSWLVSTKDHMVSDPVNVRGWAIGLKISGLSAAQLRTYVIVSSATSANVAHPDITASLPPGYVLLGGGIKVNWTGSGNLATASAPSGVMSWRARSKDHMLSSPATVDAYVIGLSSYIPGIGNFDSSINVASSDIAAHPQVSVATDYGYVLSGCGAYSNWAGAGSLLWQIKPMSLAPSQSGCELGAKDHVVSDWTWVDGYSIGLRSY